MPCVRGLRHRTVERLWIMFEMACIIGVRHENPKRKNKEASTQAPARLGLRMANDGEVRDFEGPKMTSQGPVRNDSSKAIATVSKKPDEEVKPASLLYFQQQTGMENLKALAIPESKETNIFLAYHQPGRARFVYGLEKLPSIKEWGRRIANGDAAYDPNLGARLYTELGDKLKEDWANFTEKKGAGKGGRGGREEETKTSSSCSNERGKKDDGFRVVMDDELDLYFASSEEFIEERVHNDCGGTLYDHFEDGTSAALDETDEFLFAGNIWIALADVLSFPLCYLTESVPKGIDKIIPLPRELKECTWHVPCHMKFGTALLHSMKVWHSSLNPRDDRPLEPLPHRYSFSVAFGIVATTKTTPATCNSSSSGGDEKGEAEQVDSNTRCPAETEGGRRQGTK
eukprot:jgi/Bigna1/76955/fgenesh1_pg.44_\